MTEQAPSRKSASVGRSEGLVEAMLLELREFVSVAPKRETDGSRLSATEMAVVVLNWIDRKLEEPTKLFEAFVGGFEAAYDDELDEAKVRASYDEWVNR